jgi:opacity protein-like surface antigen
MWSMVSKGANIDLLFRNGLKDFEVLPPVEVWNNILPVIRKRQRPVILLRSAALIAVLLSISFLAYRWSREISTSFQNPVLAMDEESVKMQDNSANKGFIRVLPSTDRQTAIIRQDLVPGQSVPADLIDEGNTEQTGITLIPETRDLNVRNNLMTPASIQAIKDLRYTADNTKADNKILTDFNYTEQKEKINRWSITAMASPTYYLHPELGSSEIASQISSSEQSRVSYSGGVGFSYKISKKLSIQSGLYYSSLGNEVDNINSFTGFSPFDLSKSDHNFEVLTSSGKIYTENHDVFLIDMVGDRVTTRYTNDVFDPAKANLSYINNSLFQNFSYLEMPVMVRYKLIDKNVDFNLIGGLSYNLLVNNTVHTVIDGSRYNIGKTAGLNPFMVSSSLGMGMEYNISEKFSLNLEPTFRYYLNPFGDTPGISAHPYSFGVFSGLSYKF